jgi:hypothetical protein
MRHLTAFILSYTKFSVHKKFEGDCYELGYFTRQMEAVFR